MNKFQFILSILFVSLFAVSCGDDDDESPAPVSDIVGTWTIQSSDFSILINGVEFIEYFIDALQLSEEEAILFSNLIINESGIDDFSDFGEIIFRFEEDGSYTIVDPVDGDENGTYSLNNDETEITFVSEGESYIAEVGTLTSNRMRLIFHEADSSEDIDEDGMVDTISVRVSLELIRNIP